MLGPEAGDEPRGLRRVVGVVAAGDRGDVGLGDLPGRRWPPRRGRSRRRTVAVGAVEDAERAARVAAKVGRPAPAFRAVDGDPPVRRRGGTRSRPGGASRRGRALPGRRSGGAPRGMRRRGCRDAEGHGRIVRHRPSGRASAYPRREQRGTEAAADGGAMELDGMHVAILAGEGVEDLEYWVTVMRLREAGARVTSAGLAPATVRGKNGLAVPVEVEVGGLDPDDYDGLVIPGGWMPDKLRRYPGRDRLRRPRSTVPASRSGSSATAGCIAISARIVDGGRATGSLGIRDDLVNAGATWVDEPAFRDGNLVWGRVVEDIPAFCCGAGCRPRRAPRVEVAAAAPRRQRRSPALAPAPFVRASPSARQRHRPVGPQQERRQVAPGGSRTAARPGAARCRAPRA